MVVPAQSGPPYLTRYHHSDEPGSSAQMRTSFSVSLTSIFAGTKSPPDAPRVPVPLLALAEDFPDSCERQAEVPRDLSGCNTREKRGADRLSLRLLERR
jgi:hypothetical protein